MADKILNAFDVWITAQDLKSQTRLRSLDNISFEGIKRLRGLILDLAIRGKLVAQNSKEESASILTQKFLTRESKKTSDLEPVQEKDKFMALPFGWEWVKLGSVGDTNIGLTYSPNNISDSGTPVLRSSNIQNGKISYDDLVRVSGDISEKNFVKKGDLLICARNGSKNLVGKCAIIPELNEQTSFGAFMAIFRSDINKYVKLFLQSPRYRSQLEGVSTTTINQITQDNLKNTVVPLPPLAEQQRIVAKVDELMALCDELEKQETNHLKSHHSLVETLLGTLTQSKAAAEFQSAWSRVVQHFDDVFTTEDSIDQLKQTILQLAVMGKLVPQDPNDEPASELLKRIEREKERLFSERLITKPRTLPIVKSEEEPFSLPPCWSWIRLGNAGIGNTGKTPSTNNGEYFGGAVPFIGPGQINERGEITAAEKTLTHGGSLQSEVAVPGDILMVCIGGSIGKSAIARSKVAFNQQINSIRPLFIVSEYLNIGMNARFFKNLILEKATGSATPIINRGKWEEIPIPLAPLAGQEKIVKKVDELFALCDRLKERIRYSNKIANQLADSVIHQVSINQLVADELC